MERLNKMVDDNKEQEEILEKMKTICESKGYTFSGNANKIARAKKALFGIDEWQRCPCDSKDESRFCISIQCQKDIEKDGHCHCQCYLKKKEGEE